MVIRGSSAGEMFEPGKEIRSRMPRESASAHLKRLDWTDRWLLAEACLALAVGALAIAWLPFRKLAAWLSQGKQCRDRHPEAERLVARGCWAVEAAARRLPFRTVCFQKGLALYWMMRRRGVDVRLHYGVRMTPEKDLAAHVWISHRNADVMGGEVAPDFACLATYPAEAGEQSDR